MNRLERCLPLPRPSQAAAQSSVGTAVWQREGELSCSLFMPLHYERNYAYPLLVWLHGPGEDEQQLKRIMPLVSMRNYVAVAPRGLPRRSGAGACWSWPASPQRASEIEQQIARGIAIACCKANIARNRIFLAGFGAGGTAALRVALLSPRRFAGVLSLCGGFPQGGNPLARLPHVRRLPVFLACGQYGRGYAIAGACRDLRLLHSAGMTLSLRVYPCGDEISSLMLPDMDRWMMEQISASQPVIKG